MVGQISNLGETKRGAAILRTLVMCDIVGSTAVIEDLGDQIAADLFKQHDRMVRATIQRHNGREIDKTDGFLILFEQPVAAVAFAIQYQSELRSLTHEAGRNLRARVGVHYGEMIIRRNAPGDVARGAKPFEIEGLAKPIVARLTQLGHPHQILVSEIVKTLASRAYRNPASVVTPVNWLGHGTYRLKGISDPVSVYEVGEEGIAPMRTPSNSSNASRAELSWAAIILRVRNIPLLIVVISAIVYFSNTSQRVLAFSERDWIVIGDVVDPDGNAALDATVSTAFRLGLEQSKFVNIVSDVQVRLTLERMQREQTTRVDRATASEIALREQARAVIIPTVAKYGSRLRLSAEVIDPNGGRTVSNQTSDASGPEELLSALDRLTGTLRSNLGEALQQIEASQPLEKVTTPNIQALQLYSAAVIAVHRGDIDHAVGLLSYATEIEPNFATAFALKGSLFFSQQRYSDAHKALMKALSISGRLSERERLYIRAQLARFGDPKGMAEMWRIFGNLYPDDGTGQNNVGNVLYIFFADYGGAEKALVQAASRRNPFRNFSMNTLGHVLLAQEKMEDAEQQFLAARAISPGEMAFGLSDALVAGLKFEQAKRYLDEPNRQANDVEIERGMRRATLLIARGEIEEAALTVSTLVRDAQNLSTPNPRWRAQSALIALNAAKNDLDGARSLLMRLIAELSESTQQRPLESLETLDHLVYTALWAARLGLRGAASEALAIVRKYGTLDQYPVRAALASLVEAELELSAGHGKSVADQLLQTGNGRALWEQHEIRARALRSLDDTLGEEAELRWLISHRGLAYAQWIDQLLGQQARALALRQAEIRLSHLR